ncbi:MAG: 4-hydroxy-tetrahydrodipicolinate synthase [Saprospiraceae bacterium]|uniref:4-hydroxy-tetrahydrodipicolinate synthase n=1 Tax=Candidatus Brachybacter algidus TaxID=2982024 RepID=UPI001B48A51D|nr:4-hydroxy-tetrahydrodipicolinate synthase [Candidatus Brachybacter algidus]MBP7539891.1 4-hydroxy-tetrahydrodipicolinate synthase [Saprospiraceae bacterium]MBK6375220.1 4-hydroxy-tetrahydrodipicolinate synthase [Candidatus Brachybacter algidus]MBK7604533.1 4-hydroxy-tetrahydrodipicolinate synthase [Candidatus Brachybacter algidus]MBK9550730.1 4-hydroxy-tetrahydrodipicolinate synthase [Candidatus Brachybacter algidus]MBP8893169.1 4-hydroxy-tetrahydrodipicolinate synthase [Saprospiraceae bact
MSYNERFRGTGVAVVTPFRDGKIDFPALTTVLNHVINGRVEHIVCLGTTGEATSLDQKEINSVLDHTIKIVDGRVPIIFGPFGCNNTAELVEKIKATDLSGVDAIMASSPAYVRPTQEGIYQHYMNIADASSKPVLIYNVPSRTAMKVSHETIIRLGETHTNFVGVKEATADFFALSKLIKHRPKDFLVLSGDDYTAFPTMALGADGGISVIANAFPFEFSEMIRCAMYGDYDMGMKYHMQLLDIHPWLYLEGNPTGVKGALEDLGFCSREVRLPLTPLSEGANESLLEAIEKALLTVK